MDPTDATPPEQPETPQAPPPVADEPTAAVEEPGAAVADPAPAVEEPAAAAEEPAAAAGEPPAEEPAAPASDTDAADDDQDEDEDVDDQHPTAVEENPEAVPSVDTADATGTTGDADAAEPATVAANAAAPAPPKAKPKPKRAGPDPAEVVRRIGRTNEQALAYVLDPDPKLSRLSRKVREALITDVPPVTAGALLGPAALARHFIASAAAGRYRDLFFLWDLFRARPEECKPVLAERQRALERARQSLSTALQLGLVGRADRVAEDIRQAQGLIWTWVREVVVADLAAVGRRPAVAAALLEREPALEIPLPSDPNDRWLAEAAAAKSDGTLPPQIDALLAANIDRLPATLETLQQVADQYPERVPALVERIDLQADNIGALLAWARDHGMADRLRARIEGDVTAAAGQGRAAGLAAWQAWRDRGIDLELPEDLRAPTIEGLDLARPESADVIAVLIRNGAAIDAQGELDQLAEKNRQLAEKAYESFVCAGLDVHLPLVLEGNPIVRDGTRCPACQAWTWVRPGHENRCPRLAEANIGS